MGMYALFFLNISEYSAYWQCMLCAVGNFSSKNHEVEVSFGRRRPPKTCGDSRPTSYQKKPYLSDQEHMHTSND
jgi:hypothetical protein